jgi:phage baseplate assembly protein V
MAKKMPGGILVFVKTGIVTSINPSKCTARVKFEDSDNLISAELQIVVRGSLKNKDYWMPKVGEQVFCTFNKQKNGYILGCLYSDDSAPPVTDENIRYIAFEDGTTIEYNSKNHTLSIDCVGTINIKVEGNVNVIGDVIADGISLKNHTHEELNSAPNGGG